MRSLVRSRDVGSKLCRYCIGIGQRVGVDRGYRLLSRVTVEHEKDKNIS